MKKSFITMGGLFYCFICCLCFLIAEENHDADMCCRSSRHPGVHSGRLLWHVALTYPSILSLFFIDTFL